LEDYLVFGKIKTNRLTFYFFGMDAFQNNKNINELVERLM
jgi:hypothetical protein